MARTGYLGGSIIRPGDARPARVGSLIGSNIPRATGLAAHVAEIKRQNIVLDAATIVARRHAFLTPGISVSLAAATLQHFGATGGQHAAHAVKRYSFGGDDIAEVYAKRGADDVLLIGLTTMFGLVIDVDRRANLSIDKRLETNPQRVMQLQSVVNTSIGSLADAQMLARNLEFNRRMFDLAVLQSMRGGFEGDTSYDSMLTEYTEIISEPPPQDEAPTLMVDMIASLIDS